MTKFKTTCAVILNDNNEVLLIKRGRNPHKGMWAFVSGIFETGKGYPPDEAVKREVAWDLGTSSFNGKRLFSFPIENDEETDEVIVYTGKINESEIHLKPGFSEDIQWVPIEQAVHQNLAFEHSGIIKKLLSLNI
jgi:ADP-ribose pyrophosphatase YjhB (NUDIX family)